MKFTLLAWLVVASQFSLHAHGEQKDDLAIHLQLDRLHQMASQANMVTREMQQGTMPANDGLFQMNSKAVFSRPRVDWLPTIERHIMGEDSVRWFDELLWNEKLGPCRGSGVMVKVGDEWLVSHYVLSLAVPNQIAGEVGRLPLKKRGAYKTGYRKVTLSHCAE